MIGKGSGSAGGVGPDRPLPAIDVGYLRRQTGGDAALEREVLALMQEQLAELAGYLSEAGEPESRRAIAHRLVGAARAIGAVALGEAAAAIEAAGDLGAGRGDRFAMAVADVRRFIAEQLQD